MPNGWYPVRGLDVVLINRTEQQHPRIEWNHSWDTFWAVRVVGPRGYAPRGDLRVGSLRDKPFERVIEAAHGLILGDPDLQGATASVAYVDFKKKQGSAAGSFWVYAFKGSEVSILHDHSLATQLPPGTDISEHPHLKNIVVSMVDAKGLQPAEPPETIQWHFSFEEADSLVISSALLHYDAHWPPKNSLDYVVIALANPDERDALIALWKAETKS